ncbi:antirestriction protein ArdA [Parasphingorhabdus sp. DH2-15]|uniref:antirestriction protein ArdA n=1 Tax=Parasphingorhabdus sp. DH2-15 TaxID=3444112 RepID=UPI003F687F43
MEGQDQNQEGDIRIYVACLEAYNNGILHGCWIDADQDPYDIWGAAKDMLNASPISGAEEWAIHDYEGFEGYSLSEYEGFDEISKIAAFIAEQGALGGELLSYYSNLDDAQKAIEDHYAGEYESLSDFAREVTEQSGQNIPDNLAYYIDYEAMARDMAISDVMTIETSHDQVHVFWAH